MPWKPTDQQNDVINHDVHRHARLLAGPGSGKSATVIQLMLRAAADQGMTGRLLTFTRAATNELRDKVAEHPEVLGRPSTIHSFAISTLLANPDAADLPRPIRIADDWEWDAPGTRDSRTPRRDLSCHTSSIASIARSLRSLWCPLRA